MNIRRSVWGIVAVAATLLPASALAEITDIRGRVELVIQEIRFNVEGDRDEVFEIFPDTSSDLPLQIVGGLAASGSEIAHARAAAQFADPRELNQPNPEEFAINLALYSSTPNTRYEARARASETRDIIFQPGELAEAVEGEPVLVFGRVFIDGALAIFAVDAGRDLLGAHVSLSVRVVKESETSSQTVFAGSVEINGGLAGTVFVSATGQIDTSTLILSDLSPVSDDFGVFHVLIIPNLDIVYSYEASVLEEFELHATVEVLANNVEQSMGVAALVGSPTDSLKQVIEATTGTNAATKMLAALEQERANPTGVAAFPPPPPPVPPLCGLFGIEALAGLALIGGMRFVAARRH